MIGTERLIIFHFHLFKNAGTSIDTILQQSFPGRWVTKEFPSDPINKKMVEQWICTNPQAICFSSHTAQYLPNISGIKIIPLIFVRHPIDRIVSAYNFERNQKTENFAAKLASTNSLAGYIDTLLKIPGHRQCNNFQTYRLSFLHVNETHTELSQALKAIDELPFIGVVEYFNQSLVLFDNLLKLHGFTNFEFNPVKKNISQNTYLSIETKLENIRHELGEDLFVKLEDSNQDDFTVYNSVLKKNKFELNSLTSKLN